MSVRWFRGGSGPVLHHASVAGSMRLAAIIASGSAIAGMKLDLRDVCNRGGELHPSAWTTSWSHVRPRCPVGVFPPDRADLVADGGVEVSGGQAEGGRRLRRVHVEWRVPLVVHLGHLA